MKERALVVIDVQESFRTRPIWAANSNSELAIQDHRLAETFRARGEHMLTLRNADTTWGVRQRGFVAAASSNVVAAFLACRAGSGEPRIPALAMAPLARIAS